MASKISSLEPPASGVRCVVVTPEETAVDAEADFVAVPLFDGEVGIARDHAPMIGRLGYGELRVRRGQETERYYVDGGFVQITGNVVSVLTSSVLAAEAIDVEVAQEQLDSALSSKVVGDQQLAVRDRATTQARAQLRMARRSPK